MQRVTRESRRMLRQKPASSLVTSQNDSPSYSYHAGLTFGHPSSPSVPTLTEIFVSVRKARSSAGVIPRPFARRNPLGTLPPFRPGSAQIRDCVDFHEEVGETEVRHLNHRADGESARLEQGLPCGDFCRRVT